MRKLIFSALVVLGFAFQGEVVATQLNTTFGFSLTLNGPGGEEKVYDVLDAAAPQLGMASANLLAKFEQGDATVEKVDATTYKVEVMDGGVMTGILIEDQF